MLKDTAARLQPPSTAVGSPNPKPQAARDARAAQQSAMPSRDHGTDEAALEDEGSGKQQSLFAAVVGELRELGVDLVRDERAGKGEGEGRGEGEGIGARWSVESDEREPGQSAAGKMEGEGTEGKEAPSKADKTEVSELVADAAGTATTTFPANNEAAGRRKQLCDVTRAGEPGTRPDSKHVLLGDGQAAVVGAKGSEEERSLAIVLRGRLDSQHGGMGEGTGDGYATGEESERGREAATGATGEESERGREAETDATGEESERGREAETDATGEESERGRDAATDATGEESEWGRAAATDATGEESEGGTGAGAVAGGQGRLLEGECESECEKHRLKIVGGELCEEEESDMW